MSRSSVVRLWKSRTARVVLAVIAVEAVVVLAIFGVERGPRLKAWAKETSPVPARDRYPWRKIEMKGVPCPPTVPAETAELTEDDEVIGVEVHGKTRAYALSALCPMRQHIINDLVGGVPVSVAYCDLTDCTHVYTSRRKSKPLDVAQAGVLKRKGMILKIEGVYYQHRSGDPMEPGPGVPPLPYEDHPWIRTTWRQWKQLHPGTDVYVGGF